MLPQESRIKIGPMDSGSDLTLERKVAGGNSGGEKPDESLRHLLPFFLISSTGSAKK